MDQQCKHEGGTDRSLGAGEVLRKLEELLDRTMGREGDEVFFRMTRREHHDMRGWLNSLCLLAYLGEIEAGRSPGQSTGSLDACGVGRDGAPEGAYSTSVAEKA